MRSWFITGVGSGLGQALAKAALDAGDTVVGTVRQQAAYDAFSALAPGRSIGAMLDVTDEAAVGRVIAGVLAKGPIDVLVNNAGYGFVSAVEEATLDEVRQQFEVNVIGPLATIRAVLPSMRARRSGFIVNVTSVSGLVGWPSLGIYSGSKFALEGISETLAQEIADFGLRVLMVEPGGFRTDFAGRSRAVVAEPIAAYDDTVTGACKRILVDHAGHERGDPAKAALAIIAAIDADEPPTRLLLGADALGYALKKLGNQQAEISQWIALTTSTDFDTVGH
ncbi:oxidoreductase [soil metagenome]